MYLKTLTNFDKNLVGPTTTIRHFESGKDVPVIS